MISEQITKLLRKEQKDPKEDGNFFPGIDIVLISTDIASDIKSIIEPLNLGENPCVVSDITTNIVLGQKIATNIGCDNIVLEGKVSADEKRVSEIRKMTERNTALIAVGSGTINDLCKYVSHLDNKPYIIFATALSMNGYASANASIETLDGFKRSFPAHLAKGIFFDTEILASSPRRLTSSGLADILCRTTAQADWLMSHLLLDTYYNPAPFDWLMENEEKLITSAHQLVKGEYNATITLANSIILSGLGMCLCKGSYPASQGEHLIAHTMEMKHGHAMQPSFHGEQIAITSLTMAKLQEFILNDPPPFIKPKEIREKGILDYFGDNLGAQCVNELQKKEITSEKADIINQKIDDNWNLIKTKIESKMTSYKTLKKALELAQSPTKPEDIGWDKELYKRAVKHSLLTRDRFTFLDLAYYSGQMDQFLDSL